MRTALSAVAITVFSASYQQKLSAAADISAAERNVRPQPAASFSAIVTGSDRQSCRSV